VRWARRNRRSRRRHAAAQSRRIEIEAARIRCVAELVGADTDDVRAALTLDPNRVIPGRREAASPESITGCGFRVRGQSPRPGMTDPSLRVTALVRPEAPLDCRRMDTDRYSAAICNGEP
jgi:hypothetical protein